VVYFEMADLPELEPFFTSLPTTVVVDHMGTPDVSKGVDHPQNQRFHKLLREDIPALSAYPALYMSDSIGERPAVSGARVEGDADGTYAPRL
jgi:hypothetical protein